MTVKNLIFDLGNVFFDIDMERIETGLRRRFGRQFEQAYEAWQKNRLFELYETGGINSETLVQYLAAGGAPDLTYEETRQIWNSIFIGMPARRLEWVAGLRDRYRVFLLSNINEWHAEYFEAYAADIGFADYRDRCFDGVYFSHLIRLRKPDREVFEYVLADAEILPEETLFFDDIPANVAGARSAGISAFLHPAGSEIEETFRQALL